MVDRLDRDRSLDPILAGQAGHEMGGLAGRYHMRHRAERTNENMARMAKERWGKIMHDFCNYA
jgi:hypothetical protein